MTNILTVTCMWRDDHRVLVTWVNQTGQVPLWRLGHFQSTNISALRKCRGSTGKYTPMETLKCLSTCPNPLHREKYMNNRANHFFIYKQQYYLRYYLHFLSLLSSPSYSQLASIPFMLETMYMWPMYFSTINMYSSISVFLPKNFLAIL